MNVWHVCVGAGAARTQMRALDPLELEFFRELYVTRHEYRKPNWGSLEEQQALLNLRDISLVLKLLFAYGKIDDSIVWKLSKDVGYSPVINLTSESSLWITYILYNLKVTKTLSLCTLSLTWYGPLSDWWGKHEHFWRLGNYSPLSEGLLQ